MKVGRTILISANVVLCLSFGFFVLTFNQVGKPYVRGFYCDDESLSKPFKDSTISSPSAVLVTGVISVVCFVLGDIFNLVIPTCLEGNHSFWTTLKRTRKGILRNFIIVVLIFLHGMGVTMFITDIGKYSIGRLRPHFYDVCQPDWSAMNCTSENGVKNYFVGDVHCNGRSEEWRYKNVRLSFPSGHASFAAYSATFLILYIEHFMPVMDPLLCLPKLFGQIGLASLALYCGLSRISDYKHHPTDVLAGLLLGIGVGAFIFLYVLKRACLSLLKINQASMESLGSVESNTGQDIQSRMDPVSSKDVNIVATI